jgi:hypothetical protein
MIKQALIGHLYDLKIGTTHFHIEPKGPFDRCAMTRPCWRNFASEICGLKIRSTRSLHSANIFCTPSSII